MSDDRALRALGIVHVKPSDEFTGIILVYVEPEKRDKAIAFIESAPARLTAAEEVVEAAKAVCADDQESGCGCISVAPLDAALARYEGRE